MSGAVRSLALATAPARSLFWLLTVNLVAIKRWPCSREMVDAPGRMNEPSGSMSPSSSTGETRSLRLTRGVLLSGLAVLTGLPVREGGGAALPEDDTPVLALAAR